MSTHPGRVFARAATRQPWYLQTLLYAQNGAAGSLVAPHRSCLTLAQISTFVRQRRYSTGDDLIGLGSSPVAPGTLQLLAYALGSTATLGAALSRLERVGSAVQGLPVMVCTTAGSTATLALIDPMTSQTMPPVMDTLMVLAHRLAGWATRSMVPLRRVEFEHGPPYGALDYHEIFGAPTFFNSDRSALVFDSEMLSLPLLRSVAELEELIDDAPTILMSRRDFGAPRLIDHVRILIEHNISRSQGHVDVAEQLSMCPQTLRRKLREQGTSLTLIRQDVLREAALQSLATGEESVAQLAVRLGFSEPSAFTRAFRRWTGVSPTAYRLGTAS